MEVSHSFFGSLCLTCASVRFLPNFTQFYFICIILALSNRPFKKKYYIVFCVLNCFLLWKSSEPKGNFSFDEFIMNSTILLFLYFVITVFLHISHSYITHSFLLKR